MSAPREADSQYLAELERLQFSCDLHDGILQYLVGGRILVETLQRQWKALNHREIRERLDALEKLLAEGIREGRDWIGELRREGEQKTLSLQERLQDMAERLRNRFPETPLVLDLDPGALAFPLTDSEKQGVLRIAQESLNNALRHADANRVSLTLSVESGPYPFTLEVQDDGRGFDTQHEFPDHYGLLGMKTRAELLKGEWELESNPKSGTTIRLRLPRR